ALVRLAGLMIAGGAGRRVPGPRDAAEQTSLTFAARRADHEGADVELGGIRHVRLDELVQDFGSLFTDASDASVREQYDEGVAGHVAVAQRIGQVLKAGDGTAGDRSPSGRLHGIQVRVDVLLVAARQCLDGNVGRRGNRALVL